MLADLGTTQITLATTSSKPGHPKLSWVKQGEHTPVTGRRRMSSNVRSALLAFALRDP